VGSTFTAVFPVYERLEASSRSVGELGD